MNGVDVLRWVTVAYAAVLVLALAIALTTIAVYLWRIAAGMIRVRDALARVRDETAALPGHLKPLEQRTEQRVREFEDVTEMIERATGTANEADVVEAQAARL